MNARRLAAALGLLVAVGLIAAEPQKKARKKAAAKIDTKVEATAQASCTWTKSAPKVDGVLDDDAWKSARLINKFPTFWKGIPDNGTTQAWLVWDDEALYFAAKMTDKEMVSFGTKRNDHLWNGDVFELFFKPHEDKTYYYEFQGNPVSATFQVPMPTKLYPHKDFAALPTLGMTVKAKVNGTLDTPGDVDEGWTIEGRIPWTAFGPTGGKPAPGDTWKFALCRYDYGPKGTEPVLSSSAPLTEGNYHRYEDYGKLTFLKD